MLSELFLNFSNLEKISEVSEGWSFINFKGIWRGNFNTDTYDKIYKLSKTDFSVGLTWHIDGQSIDFLSFLEDLSVGSIWELNVNKISRLSENEFNFFFNQDSFRNWGKTLEVFDTRNPLLSPFPLKIFVNGLKEDIIAHNYIIGNHDRHYVFPENEGLPGYSKISSVIHISAKKNFSIEPQKLFISIGRCTDLTLPFFELSAKALGACLVSEVVNKDLVILRGIRKIELPIYKNITAIDVNTLSQLKNTVKWVYEEKTDLKLKLFLDRFTLDVDLQKDFISELIKLNKDCLAQAKERFSFITFERKDQFQKELRDLLKDLKIVSDLYSAKLRGLLANLLRDVLAGLLLIGITILSKVENVGSVANSPITNLIFKAFAFYFLLSIIYQTIFDYIDINRTKNEFIYWKKTSREYISDSEFKTYMADTVGKREVFTYIFYSFLILTYLILAFLSYKFTTILPRLANSIV